MLHVMYELARVIPAWGTEALMLIGIISVPVLIVSIGFNVYLARSK